MESVTTLIQELQDKVSIMNEGIYMLKQSGGGKRLIYQKQGKVDAYEDCIRKLKELL